MAKNKKFKESYYNSIKSLGDVNMFYPYKVWFLEYVFPLNYGNKANNEI